MTDLTVLIESAVRAVPGVVSLYSADPSLVRSVKELALRTESLIAITGAADAPIITISVGVDPAAAAPSTAATIAHAVHAALPAGLDAEVVVRVSRVTA